MNNKNSLFLIICIYFLISCTKAQTFYIAASGLETNSGTDSLHPWPISKLSNGNRFPNGSTFLFKRGDTLKGAVYVLCNYYVANNVDTTYFGSYGVGARPIITTRTMLEGTNVASKWHLTTIPNVWRIDLPLQVPNYPRILFKRKKDNHFVEATRAVDSFGVSPHHLFSYYNAKPQWFYFYSPEGNPAAAYNIEYPSSNRYTLLLEAMTNAVVEDLDIRAAGTASIDVQFCTGVSIRNCNIGWDAMRQGIRTAGPKNLDIFNNQIDSGDRIKDSINFKILNLSSLGLSDGVALEVAPQNIRLHHNTIRNFGHTCFAINSYAKDKKDSVKNIRVYDNILEAPDVDYCRGFGIETNYSVDSGIIIENNIIKHTTVANQILAKGLIIRNNIFWDLGQVNHYDYSTGFALNYSNYAGLQPQGMMIENNVFAYCGSGALYAGGDLKNDSSGSTIMNNTFRNNIIYNCGNNVRIPNWFPSMFKNGIGIYIYENKTVQNNVYTGNDVFNTETDTVIQYKKLYTTIAGFNALNESRTTNGKYDVIKNNLQINPIFNDPVNGDFRFKYTSPLIGKNIGVRPQIVLSAKR